METTAAKMPQAAKGRLGSGSEGRVRPPANDEEDVRGRISAMLEQERRYLCRDNLLEEGGGGTVAAFAARRARVCRWMFDVIDRLGLQRETAVQAVSYLDRLICSGSPLARRARHDTAIYQLASMTCLYIAAKIHEPVGIDVSTLGGLSRGLHSAEDMIECERHVLRALLWRLNGPTPTQFARCALELLPESPCPGASSVAPALDREASSLAERAVGDYACVVLRRSSVAAASILESLEGIPREALPPDERERFVGAMSGALGVDAGSPLIKAVRRRLRGASAV